MKTKFQFLTAATVLSLAMAGCGGGAPSPQTGGTTAPGSAAPSVALDPEVAKLVPEKYKGGAKVAVFGDWAPEEYVENNEVKGWAVDMAKVISAKSGVQFDYQPSGFDAILPGLGNGRYDLAVASLGVTDERMKSIDFVPLQKDGTAFAWKKGNDAVKVTAAEDACGRSVAVLTGAWEYQYLTENNEKLCRGNPMNVQQFKDQPAAEMAVNSGRVDLVAAGSGKLAYAAKQSGQLEVSSLLVDAAYNGLGLPKNSEFGPAVRAAVQSMIDDGTYKKIRQDWGVSNQGDLDKGLLMTEKNPQG
ncbi:ABC transporter substrate-binding protein [Mariniluteicoccus endophyticus]